MSHKIQDVVNLLEDWAPSYYAEEFDNMGLLVGNKAKSLTGVLVTLDTTEAIVDEAVKYNCNLIVSFHPIIFKGLKQLTGSNYVERTVLKAITHDIAIYAIHTALDNSMTGVNAAICHQLGLSDLRVLIPKTNVLKKLITYAPTKNAENIREALLDAGAGQIGHYDKCSFSSSGTGTFRATQQANPSIGEIGVEHKELETKIEVLVPAHLQTKITKVLNAVHPYEEVAYDVISLDNKRKDIGMGMVGKLSKPLSQKNFLGRLNEKFHSPQIRYTDCEKKDISTVAVLGGSGSFAIAAAKAIGADAFVTSDLKYHDFFQAENRILLADIGHYESEQFTKNLIADYLKEKMPNFAILLTAINTNPVRYYKHG